MGKRERGLDGHQSRRAAHSATSMPESGFPLAEGLVAVLPPLDPSPVDEASLDLDDAERASLSRNRIVRDVQLRAFREGRRSLVVDPDPAEVEAAARAAILAKRAARWDGFVPPRFAAASLDLVAERDNDLAVALLGWAGGRRPNLILTGPMGVGKTFTALAAIRADVEDGAKVRYWSTGRLLQELRPGASATPEVLAGLLDADVLILDDLGVEKVSEWTSEQLSIVVDDRYQHLRPVIVTTNDLGSLAGSTRDRGRSRLLDGATVLSVGGARLR